MSNIKPKGSIVNNLKIIAYLKPWCGWSKGVRAVLQKYNLEYEDRDIINDSAQREEMVAKSGQELSPCVEINGTMLADISGDELEAWMLKNNLVKASEVVLDVPIDRGCSDEEHAAQAEQVFNVNFIASKNSDSGKN
jgi:glutaredoxin